MSNNLTIIKRNGSGYIDSREVAEVIGKAHRHLLRDIRGYCEIMEKGGAPNFGLSDFFLESSYQSAQNKEMPCYLLSKMGCELVANKLTGEKGVLFTAAYVSKFNEMETAERAVIQAPRLGEYNAAARLIVRELRRAGSSPAEIVDFLKELYEPLGITVNSVIDLDLDFLDDDDSPMYTATQIAKKFGVYSGSGKPHALAVSAILNDILLVPDTHKSFQAEDFGDRIGILCRYDIDAVIEVGNWLMENECPDDS